MTQRSASLLQFDILAERAKFPDEKAGIMFTEQPRTFVMKSQSATLINRQPETVKKKPVKNIFPKSVFLRRQSIVYLSIKHATL